MIKLYLAIILVCITCNINSQSKLSKENSEKWELNLTPYIWTVGMKGDIIVNNIDAPLNLPFSDAVENFTIGGMFHAEAKKGKWSVMTDIFYAKLNQNEFPIQELESLNTEITVTQTMIELGGGYTFAELKTLKFDVLFGARYFDLDMEISADNISSIAIDENFIDPFIGLRIMNYWNKFFIQGRIDVGGFGVGSEVSYKFNGMLGYQFTKLFQLSLGYQVYNPRYENKSQDLIYDLASQGFILGGNFRL
ncbi:hypothetical protein [Hanstruepera marina]|uniref:hypothetical protein n=1 Tax=Hanstruepera marina TaxID=2873265 RepID=UPI001CA6BA3D|nr:hypothetical protein [Hanstruepera marina]